MIIKAGYDALAFAGMGVEAHANKMYAEGELEMGLQLTEIVHQILTYLVEQNAIDNEQADMIMAEHEANKMHLLGGIQ